MLRDVILFFLLFAVSIWFSFVLWLITKDVKEKKRKDKENVGTRMSRVQEAQHDLVDLQTRDQIPRPYRGERLLEVYAIVIISDVNIITSASKQEIKACIGPGTSF